MRKILFTLQLLATYSVYAQMPGGMARPGGMGGGANMNVGHLYGKITEEKSNKGVDGATIQLLGNRFDTATKRQTEVTLKTLISESNGDFSLENLPVFGSFKLRISAIGYKPVEQKVSFSLNMPKPGEGGAGGGMQQMLGMVDKDLGNIKMTVDASVLADVTVTSTKQMFEMGIDRKIFNVDKNLVSSGQSATEVMKSIPSLSVDIDGNVTLRNATPQLFVDGRPTTLTMDQIPADMIDRVELITNPSAKFDASGGNAGILNIVLKKNKKIGYNGGIRGGVDTRGKVNLGGDINFRQNKINFFASGMYNQRKSKSWGTTDRLNTTNVPSRIYQTSRPVGIGSFAFGRAGFDYLVDNRNTITVTGNYVRGNFSNDDQQRIDSFINNTFTSYNSVLQNSKFNFRNLGSQFSFKHNFAKTGHEITADANYNASKNDNNNFINTQTFTPVNDPKKLAVMQQTFGSGKQTNLILQSDYANPITDKQKIEFGLRGAIRNFENNNDQFFFDHFSKTYKLSKSISSKYKYTDQVYAAYATYSLQVKKMSYQFGLRAESSTYDGELIGQNSKSDFKVDFPLSFFPSTFITYKLTDKQDVQFNYSRRINRPNFFQLIPFIDYSDPQNLSVGNAGLKPEFTNSLELSYNYSYKKGANFLASTFLKQNNNLITRFQYYGANPDTGFHYSSLDSVLFNTYLNANNSITFGIELTNRMPVTKWYDMTLNFNLFNSKLNITDPKLGSITNQRTSWFVKLNNNIKIKKTWSVQLSGEYYAKTVLPPEGGRGGGRGGMMWGGGPTATAQGYINPRYGFDIAVRKDWTWKGGNSASLTLSMNDFLRTQLFSTYSESPFLKQTSERRRDPQVARLNFSYRFGKFDVSLFKRKNTKADQSGGEMPIQQ
ncbi:MAG: TonB-dependent receptor family protein [Chitinophagaceae bacterium]|nr:TonB-dependent receptor family protein [Chitinophagaceae bacterium]